MLSIHVSEKAEPSENYGSEGGGGVGVGLPGKNKQINHERSISELQDLKIFLGRIPL